MATVELIGICKAYPNGYLAIRDLDLYVNDGEFLILVGPSGCGKSTALRMVAGLEDVSQGDLRIGGRSVVQMAPKDRDIAMVFQNYALYPHMSVAENIGFSLKLASVRKPEREVRIRQIARTLELESLLGNKPSQLSGGQRQRVAMGRAMVREPSAFLMDEPLSNLDAKLRVQMRAEIAQLQRKLSVTTLYVTHDQVEAMTMGDRVAVLKGGVLQQIGTPAELYRTPINAFVAGFIGSPSMNLFEANLDDRRLMIGQSAVTVPDAVFARCPALSNYNGKPIVIGIRPEDLADATLDPGSARASISALVTAVEELGAEHIAHLKLDAKVINSGDPDAIEDINKTANAVARFDRHSRARAQDTVPIAIDPHLLHFFDPVTHESVV